MTKRKFVGFFVVALLHAACASASSQTPTSTLTLITPTATPAPTNTPNPTPTPSLPDGYHINCLDLLPELPEIHAFEGSLIFNPNSSLQPIILDILSEKETYLASENELSWKFEISPNGRLLAYSRTLYDGPLGPGQPPSNEVMDWLVITSSNDEEISRLPWGDHWAWIIKWLSNDLLLMSTDENRPFILNPFTGQETQISVNFADIYNIPPHLWWRQYGSDSYVVVDPTLRWAIYPNKDQDTYIIWDLTTGEEATRLPTRWLTRRPPIWSPDSSQFLISKFTRHQSDDYSPNDELYSVNRGDWQVTQLTNLGAIFPAGVEIDWYSWSPDGSKIAFTFWAFPPFQPGLDKRIIGDLSNAGSLAIIDTTTNTVSFLCINTFAGYPVYWSPDSSQLLVLYRTAEYIDSPALIDMAGGFAVPIASDYAPRGWMVNAPEE